MQISPSTNLFRALGNLPQAHGTAGSHAAAVKEASSPTSPSAVAQRRQQPAAAMQLANAVPSAPPAANLPRGSLINLRV